MPDNKINILCTAALDGIPDILTGEDRVVVDIVPFIETAGSTEGEMGKKILKSAVGKKNVVFSSSSSVKAVADVIGTTKPEWTIYCVEGPTRELVATLFGEAAIAGTGRDARQLAGVIGRDRPEEIIFFCGNLRREELPHLLSSKGITVIELQVYKTTLTPHRLDKDYEGICFFSPSAVESFFSSNPVSVGTVLFAIGPTTADAIRGHCSNRIITGERAGKELLVRQSIDYFLQKEISSSRTPGKSI
jgi:uroporphyrinogen-III synthase